MVLPPVLRGPKGFLLTLAIALLCIFVLYVASLVFMVARNWDKHSVPASVPLRVDPSLAGQEAWIALRDSGASYHRQGEPLVRVVDAHANPLDLDIFEFDVEGGSDNLRLDLAITLGQSETPAQVEMIWYDDRQITFFSTLAVGREIRGTVTVDADRPPGPGDPRIVAYDLQALHDDRPVNVKGRVRVSADGSGPLGR